MKEGQQEAIAVDCWFTSTGQMHLRHMKVRSGDAILRIDHIQILTEEARRYAGIPVREFHCRTEQDGREVCFTILFYPELCRWKLLIP